MTEKGDGIFSAVLWPESSMVAIETMYVFFEVHLRLMKQLNVKHMIQ